MANTPAKRKRRSEDTFAIESSAKKRKTPSSLYFEIRDVLKYRNGRYLVQWEDNPDTGEKYSPTWEPKKNLNEEALEHWKQNQAKQQQVDKVKTARKRLSESQVPYEESTPVSVRGRRDKRRKIVESSPAAENLLPVVHSSANGDVGNTSEDSPTPCQKEDSAQWSDPFQASPTLTQSPSYTSKSEKDSSDSDLGLSNFEILDEPKGKDLVSQATPQDPEIVLAQKSINYEEYTSFSAPATQETATDSTVASQVQPLTEGENPTNDQIVRLANSSSQAVVGCDQSSTENTFQELAQESQTSNPARAAAKDALQEHASDCSVQQLIQESPQQSTGRTTIHTAVSYSPAEVTQEPSRDSITSEPTTNSKPSNESYVPVTGCTQTTPESHVENTSSDHTHAQQTSSVDAKSSSVVKIVPDSQIVDNSETFVPPESLATSHTSTSTTSGSVTQDQTQDIPESSPIEVFHTYHCFYAWKDQYIYIDAKSRKA
ncbi:hypothetical protein EV356DRAFT_252042 [Viridothelium virens]|uniref:Chromo domain-containing protein n=1 Tax=Viridothelium virens TaxID=1048519 RepID=A0A6A6H3C5_VIRVR|nr:hypothetical protein EV356DRAFT_252042 [Viridothelium virens]